MNDTIKDFAYITFNTKGYDAFIDFIKAYAILCVLFAHTFPWPDKVAIGIWCDMQVPLFVLVQTFHCYKKDKISIDIKKIMRRVMIPFFIIEIITFVLSLLMYRGEGLFVSGLCGGGLGPGCYYPWIYFQVALLLPLFAHLLKQCDKRVSFVVFLLICEGFEVIFSLISLPDFIYRLLSIRYIFLLWYGWQWAKDGIRVNLLMIVLSLISLASIVYFEYFSVNDEPWFYLTGWKYHRWPCYYFVAYGLIIFLNSVWHRMGRNETIKSWVKKIASCSYDIFLVQMSVLFLFPRKTLSFITNDLVQLLIWIPIVWLFSIGGGFWLNKLLKNSIESKIVRSI